MPPGLQRLRPLRLGDTVSVAVWRFGEDYAKTRVEEGQDWKSEDVRDTGKIVGKDASGTLNGRLTSTTARRSRTGCVWLSA